MSPKPIEKNISGKSLSGTEKNLVSHIRGPRPIVEVEAELCHVQAYLSDCGMSAMKSANIDTKRGALWGRTMKRTRVKLSLENRPNLVPSGLTEHNLVEVINQCATIERLIDSLKWATTPESGLANYLVERCHPATSSRKAGNVGERDNDLVLVGPNGEMVCFEISDVVSGNDSNKKEISDLRSLHLPIDKKGQVQKETPFPLGRMFLVVSTEFANGLRRRDKKWKSSFWYNYIELPNTDTVLVEIQQC